MKEETGTLHQYIAIDLKSFYASVECVERGLDPLDTCLVVADPSRTEKTICLAVSPALKSYGIGGRPRLFEVVQRVREVNRQRGRSGKSHSKKELDAHRELAVDYLVAPHRPGGHPCLFHRRGFYGRDILPEELPDDGSRAGHENHPGGAGRDRHHRHRWHWHEPLSLQGSDGHCGQENACR